jgi:uncharacterized protein (TIGR03118 family)
MKMRPVQSTRAKTIFCLLFLVFIGFSCKKADTVIALPTYQVISLVSDVATYQPETVDPGLVNPWGIAIGPTGAFWISDNHSGLTTIYDGGGNIIRQPVDVPFHGQVHGGAPTGVVFNTTSDFLAPSTGGVPRKALFIYATEDGTVAAWNGSDSTVTVADRSSMHAVYKGITIGANGGNNFIYAADFRNGRIDVLDKDFNYVNMNFSDPTIPAGFAPFNIKQIAGKLYVTYAKQSAPDNEDDERGVGNGFVNVFNTDGSLLKRFASQGNLNSPWGITAPPAGFGLPAGSIIVGNFGDGHLNVFDGQGKGLGELKSGNTPIVLEGLWDLTFEDGTIQGSDPNILYYTAGPGSESHGLFGYLKKRP